ncbi:VOC family protein [Arthrobacter sp. NPDC089319]|uniref:VOC family protein n=1 Tax=Arthrobacter sp. NPDC089319 TaxID=3155915 RepID=UPI00341FC71B
MADISLHAERLTDPAHDAYQEPIYDVAQLGHVEILTPRLQDTADFFTRVYGLYTVEETADSLYLRAWNDDVLTSLKITAASEPGPGHVAWRCTSPQALERRVAALEAKGVQGQWTDGDIGHGPAYEYRGPGGHLQEIYFETDKYVAPAGQKPYLPNQPQKYNPHGVAAAHLDHINLLVPDVTAASAFAQESLGFKLRERLIPAGSDDEVGAWLSLMTKAHDLALTQEPYPTEGRLHHLAYAVESREDVLRAADIFMENNVPIDFGPAKHSRTQGFFLYVIEPGGNRVEVFSGGIHIYSPDFETVTWDTETGGRSTAWGLATPPSFKEYATPVYEAP